MPAAGPEPAGSTPAQGGAGPAAVPSVSLPSADEDWEGAAGSPPPGKGGSSAPRGSKRPPQLQPSPPPAGSQQQETGPAGSPGGQGGGKRGEGEDAAGRQPPPRHEEHVEEQSPEITPPQAASPSPPPHQRQQQQGEEEQQRDKADAQGAGCAGDLHVRACGVRGEEWRVLSAAPLVLRMGHAAQCRRAANTCRPFLASLRSLPLCWS